MNTSFAGDARMPGNIEGFERVFTAVYVDVYGYVYVRTD